MKKDIPLKQEIPLVFPLNQEIPLVFPLNQQIPLNMHFLYILVYARAMHVLQFSWIFNSVGKF